MIQRPLHYDGSSLSDFTSSSETTDIQALEITDEIRKNIAGNPYDIKINE